MIEIVSIKYIVYVGIAFFSSASIYFLYIGINAGRIRNKNSGEAMLDNTLSFVDNFVSKTVRKKSELLPKRLVGGKALTHTASHIAMSNIEYLTKIISSHHLDETPYLFGVNKGGSLIANYVAHRLGLHETYLVKCDWDPETQVRNFEEKEIRGPIIILDDVSRSGKTIKTVRSILESKYPESSIYCMVLVMTTSGGEESVSEGANRMIDYAAWYTSQSFIRLPWSLNSENLLKVNQYFEDEEMDQVAGRFQAAETGKELPKF